MPGYRWHSCSGHRRLTTRLGYWSNYYFRSCPQSQEIQEFLIPQLMPDFSSSMWIHRMMQCLFKTQIGGGDTNTFYRLILPHFKSFLGTVLQHMSNSTLVRLSPARKGSCCFNRPLPPLISHPPKIMEIGRPNWGRLLPDMPFTPTRPQPSTG